MVTHEAGAVTVSCTPMATGRAIVLIGVTTTVDWYAPGVRFAGLMPILRVEGVVQHGTASSDRLVIGANWSPFLIAVMKLNGDEPKDPSFTCVEGGVDPSVYANGTKLEPAKIASPLVRPVM